MRLRTAIAAGVATGAAALVLGAAALTASGPSKAVASSHREAPLIANDPTADLTDFYLFPSPERAGTVTMIANVIPLEAPPRGRTTTTSTTRRATASTSTGTATARPIAPGRCGRTRPPPIRDVPLQHRPDPLDRRRRTSASGRPGRCGVRRATGRASRSAPASRRPTTSARTRSPNGTTPSASRPSRRSATARRSTSARARIRSRSTSAGSST